MINDARSVKYTWPVYTLLRLYFFIAASIVHLNSIGQATWALWTATKNTKNTILKSNKREVQRTAKKRYGIKTITPQTVLKYQLLMKSKGSCIHHVLSSMQFIAKIL